MNYNGRMQYLKNRVETASPIGRIVILYEACIRFLEKAQNSYSNGDKLGFVDSSIKGQNIIRELRNSLNLDIDETVGGGFYRLYNYMLKELSKGIRYKKTDSVTTVIKQMQVLYKSWKTAEEKGLGRDVKRYEERVAAGQAGLCRKVEPMQNYDSLNEGLSLMS